MLKTPVQQKGLHQLPVAHLAAKAGGSIQLKQPSTGIDFTQSPTTIQSLQPPVQRKIIRYKPAGAPKDANERDGQRVAKVVDDAVTDAYLQVTDGNYKGASDGHINLYKKRLVENKPSLARAAAGYVIEDIASNEVKKAEGDKIELQNTSLMKGTRPDIVYNIDDNTSALIDITSVRQAGHIFKKKGNWVGHKNIPYVAESIYPTVDLSGSTANLRKLDYINVARIAEKNLEKQKAKEKRMMKAEKFKSARYGGALGKRGKAKAAKNTTAAKPTGIKKQSKTK